MRVYLLYGLLVGLLVGLGLGLRRAKPGLMQRLMTVGLIVAGLAVVGLLGVATEPQARDLLVDFTKAYYPAGQAVWQDPATLYARADDDLTFVNLPLVALLFAPFGLLDAATATDLMMSLGILATAVALYGCLVLSRVQGWRRWVVVGLFAMNGPLFYNLRIGNTTQYTLLLLVGVLLALRRPGRSRELLAGALLAIAGVIKVPLLLLVGCYVLRGRWRVVLGFGATLGLVGLISLGVFGPELHVTWYRECIQPFAGKPLSAFNVQSIDGWLARVWLGGELRNWQPIAVDWGYKLVRYGLVASVVGSALWVGWRTSASATAKPNAVSYSEFAIALCLALIISPISWTHYYLLLLLPLSLWLGHQLAIPDGRGWTLAGLGATVMISLPTVNPQVNSPALQWLVANVWISHYLYGVLLLLGVLEVGLLQTRLRHH
jgi:hypothetical protein